MFHCASFILFRDFQLLAFTSEIATCKYKPFFASNTSHLLPYLPKEAPPGVTNSLRGKSVPFPPSFPSKTWESEKKEIPFASVSSLADGCMVLDAL